MSATSPDRHAASQPTRDRLNEVAWGRWPLFAGITALALCALGALLGGLDQFFRAYFTAYVYFLGLALGGMAILMIYHLTGGAWGYLIRRVLEAQMRTLPLLALFFIPVAFGVETLYLWAQPKLVAESAHLQSQQFYLNVPFFLGRAVVYFCLWLLLAWMLRLKSARQERTLDERSPLKLERFSELGLVLFGTSMHFSAFDWLETLQPNFHSTLFPMLIVAGQLLSALSLAVVVFVVFVLPRDGARIFSQRAFNDLGNILLAFLIIWSYMVWFQFMLIWIADMPSDVLWYSPRSQGGWKAVIWFLVFAGFAIPLFLLLMQSVKRNPVQLARVCGLILFSQLVFNYYLIVPVFDAPSLLDHWMDFLTPIGVGGVWFALFVNRLRSAPLLVQNDPNLESALHLRSLDEAELEREHALLHSQSFG